MAAYVKYPIEDGGELIVEILDTSGFPQQAGIGDTVEKAKQTFGEAIENVRLSALQIRKKLHDLQADEVEVKFGLKATGEVGNNVFAVTSAGVEANYEVTLRWVKKDLTEVNERIRQIRLRKLKRKTWSG